MLNFLIQGVFHFHQYVKIPFSKIPVTLKTQVKSVSKYKYFCIDSMTATAACFSIIFIFKVVESSESRLLLKTQRQCFSIGMTVQMRE